MKQYEAVILTLERLGGIATLGEINQNIFKVDDCIWKTKTPFASIRRIVQENPDIYKIKPGLYALKKYRSDLEHRGIFAETQENKNSQEIINFNHTYYQGLLVTIGNLKKMKTFIPNQDKNKQFLNKKLGDIRTLDKLPNFSYDFFLSRISTIDVVWFNDRMMPSKLFEVEHSTDIQNSLLKFNDLCDFSVKMLIVADKCRKDEFNKKIGYSSFKDLKDRVLFLNYDELVKQYEIEIQKSCFEIII
ncbi:MAG: hypothetical protein IIX64_05125 [Bacteroidales bacterium]|nr:hypothetical protein [Bacteroidales bacterium]